MSACIHPLHVYDVLTYTTADTSGNFEAQDLQDSMDHFWSMYDTEHLDVDTAGARAAYINGMRAFKTEATTAEYKYNNAMRSVSAHTPFINEVDTADWNTNMYPRGIWRADNGTMLSTRAALTRFYKRTMLSIFRRLIPFHCRYRGCSWALRDA